MDLQAALPRSMMKGLVRIDEPLLVERYRAAQQTLGQTPTAFAHFHVDAGGYSPEIAVERSDPYYLAEPGLRAHAVLVSERQLSARLVHPGLSAAAAAYTGLLVRFRAELSQLTLREPILVEAHPGAGPVKAPRDLAQVQELEISFSSPTGRLRDRQLLEERKHEFLASERMWLDDEAIRDMLDLARRVRELGPLPSELLSSRHPVVLFYTPGFGGSYVLTEKGGRRPTTYVLTREPADSDESARGVKIEPLDPGAVVELLRKLSIADFDADLHRRQPAHLERRRYWLALDHLLAQGDGVPDLDPRVIERRMHSEEMPQPYLELAEVTRSIESRSRVSLDDLAPETALRLLLPTSRRERVRAFVRHLLAEQDPTHLAGQWLDAPDVLFARLGDLGEARLALLGRWLESNAASGASPGVAT